MSLTKAKLLEVMTTASAKFVDSMQARTDNSYEAIVTRDSFGSAGYTPFLLGGFGSGRLWSGARLFKRLKSYGVKFMGMKFEDTYEIEADELADNPALSGAKIGKGLSSSAARHEQIEITKVLSENKAGFDGEPLFGVHEYLADDGTTVIGTYTNDIAGSAAPFYLANKQSLLIADRDGENYRMQTMGGGDSEHTFVTDNIAFGWRARKIFAPCLAFNTIRSANPVTEENVLTAYQTQIGFRSDSGQPLDNAPTHIVVKRGTAQEAAAERLLTLRTLAAGGDNPMYNKLKILALDDL